MNNRHAKTPNIEDTAKKDTLIELARNAYDAGDLVLAKEILKKLDLKNPDVQSLRISVDAGLHDWGEVKESLNRLNDNSSSDKDWALSNLFQEISGLVDRRFYDHAHEAVQIVPESSELSGAQTFTLARVYLSLIHI